MEEEAGAALREAVTASPSRFQNAAVTRVSNLAIVARRDRDGTAPPVRIRSSDPSAFLLIRWRDTLRYSVR
jgi:hypothetical protein